MAAFREKQFAKCARLFADAVRTEPKQALAPLIGAARCHAGAGDAVSAAHYLDLALQRGYRNCKVLNDDAVFADLRAGAGWAASMDRCRLNEDRFYASLNPEIYVAYLADQADRKGEIADVATVRGRDADRRRLVRTAIRQKALKTADDFYHAAMIMQHGETAEEIDVARTLARRAMTLDPSHANALWLYAAATDRWLQMSGRPQIYGTQLRQTDGKWTREPYDRAAVTDAERERLRVPSLSEQQQEIDELNAP